MIFVCVYNEKWKFLILDINSNYTGYRPIIWVYISWHDPSL